MKSIVFAAVSKHMEEVARGVLAEMGLDIETDTSPSGIELVEKYPEVRVFISRGGRAQRIHKETGKPVVNINVSFYDLLPPLHRMLSRNVTKIAIVTNSSFIVPTSKSLQLGSAEILVRTWSDIVDLPEILEELSRHGVKGIVGDRNGTDAAKGLGFITESLDSGPEAIRKAICDALEIAAAQETERVRNEQIRTIVNSSAEGILAVDRNGVITVCNPAAFRMLDFQESNVVGKNIRDVRPDEQLSSCLHGSTFESEGVKQVGNHYLAIRRIPIKLGNVLVGAVANMQDVTQLQSFEQVIRQKLNQKGLLAKYRIENLIGSSSSMQAIKERIRHYAQSDGTVMISGESGTGKEGAAQSIHNLSNRKGRPFVAINCAALPESLLESELFGYVEGAFTGAKKSGKQGLFEIAHSGTIFLDEINDMPLSLQSRLLRVLQEREVMRLGADNIIPVNVRVIAATNQGLIRLIEEKKFREDLYYRLNVLQLNMSPLRDRIDDIPELVKHMLSRHRSSRSKVQGISDGAIKLLQSYNWPGNIRELENIIERLSLLATGPQIEATDIQRELVIKDNHDSNSIANDDLNCLEKQKIAQVLLEEKFNYSKAAQRLGISRTTLWRKARL